MRCGVEYKQRQPTKTRINAAQKSLPKCLSLSSQMFRDTGSRRLRIAKTTINSTAMPIVNNVPVNKAANGKIDKPSPPSIDKRERKKAIHEIIYRFMHVKQTLNTHKRKSNVRFGLCGGITYAFDFMRSANTK